jgi:beta,beta-carotene 9',10'-dioxygenase
MAAVLKPAVAQRPAEAPGRLRGFASTAREIDDSDLHVEGRLPDWLRGRLLLNGPALWSLPQGGYEHWFDGLAMFHRIEIGAGRVRYRSRFARSEDYTHSLSAGRPAFGAFDTRNPMGFFRRMLHLRNPPITDNPAVVMSHIGDRWVANTETPHLTSFDPDTLATMGRLRFDDGVRMQLMSAHGRTDERGDYWNVGIHLGPKCTYKLIRMRAGTRRREVLGSLEVRRAGYTHAFAMTPSHAVIWETALRAMPLSFLFTGRAYIRNFRWEPASGSRLHAILLDDGSVRSWDIAPMLGFHAIQAWNDGQDIVLEMPVFDDARVLEDLRLDALRQGQGPCVPRLLRYRMKPGRQTAEAEVFGSALELPQVHPQRDGRARASVTWGAGTDATRPALFDRTVRLDLESGEWREWCRGDAVQLEPLFVPRPGGTAEDDGVLLVPTLADGDTATQLGVIDARSMQCLALLQAPQVVPFGFHAAWAGP